MGHNKIVTRFAPSPTGFLHLGGARTALFNFLHAKQHNGDFRLRVEDTDRNRSSEKMTRAILDGLSWLGMKWDGEVIFQGENSTHHHDMGKILLRQNRAYRCFCTPEELKKNRIGFKYNQNCRDLNSDEIVKNLESGKAFSIRFKVPRGKISWNDVIHNRIEIKNEELEDFVLVRSDGSPTYQLAVVIDDHQMGVNYIIRGEDHIPNTPKQILLYKAFHWDIPIFAHVPLILGSDKSRLSKRHGATSLEEYRQMGVLPEALFNYLILLGWTPEDQREILDQEDVFNQFSIQSISKKSAMFDQKKLAWINQQYINKSMPSELFDEITKRWIKFGFIKESILKKNKHWIYEIIDLLKLRAVYLNDFIELARYFFKEPNEYDLRPIKKYLSDENIWQLLDQIKNQLTDIDIFEKDRIEKTIRDFAARADLKAAKLIHPIRLALTGRTASPGLFEMMSILGKETVLNRLNIFLGRQAELKGRIANVGD
jgi:glutamyl-tRNA synthetase